MMGVGAAAAFAFEIAHARPAPESAPTTAIINDEPAQVTPTAAPEPTRAPQPAAAKQSAPAPTIAPTPKAMPAAKPPLAPAPAHKRATGSAPASTAPATGSDAAPSYMFDVCDEHSCAASNYERECCAPYKNAAPDLAVTLDRIMIAGALASIHPLVEQCGSADIQGTVKVHIKVAPSGAVVESEPRDTPDPTLGECVASAVQKAQFPRTRNGGSFTNSFSF